MFDINPKAGMNIEMKLEIDTSDPDALNRQKQEFLTAIRIIDAALSSLSSQPVFPSHKDLPPATTNRTAPTEDPLNDLPTTFNSSDLYTKFPGDRMEAKTVIRKALENGKIRILERGAGRRPTTYEKIIST